jgi:hypothetical protein
MSSKVCVSKYRCHVETVQIIFLNVVHRTKEVCNNYSIDDEESEKRLSQYLEAI